MNDLSDFTWIETGFREHRRDAHRRTLTWIERRRRCLVDVDLAIGESKNYIGKGSADVDPDPRRTMELLLANSFTFGALFVPITQIIGSDKSLT